MKTILPFLVYAFFGFACSSGDRSTAESTQVEASDTINSGTAERWSTEKAQAWQEEKGWLVGCNFSPSTAINQLEMWQEETFDPETIDRELGWAEDLGFNSIRVYLHDLLWEQDSCL